MINSALKQLLHRPKQANKYDFGHVLILGGSPGAVGAPLLTAMAALRMGAGLVTIATQPEVADKLEKRVLEVMTFRLPATSALTSLQQFIETKKVNTLIFGPGLQTPNVKIVPKLLQEVRMPTVLDAAALTYFSKDLKQLKKISQANGVIIATPHDGEFKKLTGKTLPQDTLARLEVATTFAQSTDLTLICKGFHTIVSHPDGTIYQEQQGNPGLATAGAGDVLAGVIGGLLAQSLSVKDSSELGVHLHAVAGDLAAAAKTEPGVVASDIIDFLPQALRESVKQAR